MLNISKGHPWIFWPSSICDTYPANPCNKILDGKSSFNLNLDIEFTDKDGSLFAILPHFTGLEIENKTLKFTFTYNSGAVKYNILDYSVNPNNRAKITLEHKKDEYFKITVNRKNLLLIDLTKDRFKENPDPHIIFGASNFPKNKFNLKYNDIKLHNFKVKQNNKILSHHKFEKFIFDKSFDLTNNLNFIHKL